jgi:hypothetical protein
MRDAPNGGSTLKGYLLSVPERLVRSVLGLGAGAVREAGEVVLPAGVRRTHLYQNLVDGMLRFLNEKVGGVESLASADGALPDRYLARRTAGNAVEVLGIVAFRASPVWVLSALADVVGTGKQLIPEIADALKERGLLEEDAEFTSVDQILDGLERTSSRLAGTINAPPLDIAGLRAEWEALREDARKLRPAGFPSPAAIRDVWTRLVEESDRQGRSVFETSSVMAVSAARALPERIRWLGASAAVGATRTGQLFATAILDHYRMTLGDMAEVGYLAFARRQLGPYVRAAVGQFSPGRRSLTERALDKIPRIARRGRRSE